MANHFADPLFLFLLCLIPMELAFGVHLLRHENRQKFYKLFFVFQSILFAFLWLFSSPFFAWELERSLFISKEPHTLSAPAIIVVLSGGYQAGSRPEEDSLSTESTQRVRAAVHWWRSHPQVPILTSGRSSSRTSRSLARDNNLMRQFAAQNGVPSNLLLEENESRNTWEHPLFLKTQFPWIREDTPIGVVTSEWHLKRALFVFKKYFKNTIPYPFAERVIRGYELNDWLPSTSALLHSTTMLHEWVGLLWYRLKG